MRYYFLRRIVFLLVLAFTNFQIYSQSIDESFNPIIKGWPQANAIHVQHDGKYLLGGRISFVGPHVVNDVFRLNSDATIDLSFSPQLQSDEDIYKILETLDKKILINQYSTAPTMLNSDGTLDNNFKRTAAVDILQNIFVLGDKIMLFGVSFGLGNRLVQILPDGSVDALFDPIIIPEGFVWDMDVQSDGKFLITGSFNKINDQVVNGIVRINADGSIDETFVSGVGLTGVGKDIEVLANDQILLAGDFNLYNQNAIPKGLVKLNADGSMNNNFIIDQVSAVSEQNIEAVVTLTSGKIVVQGKSFDGTFQNFKIFGLNADGSLDMTYAVASLRKDYIDNFRLQTFSNEVVCVGNFKYVNGLKWPGFAVFDSNGIIKSSKNPKLGGDPRIEATIQQPDGKMILGGKFIMVNDSNVFNLVRLNEDGSIDKSFQSDFTLADQNIYDFEIQNNGKIIVGGNFGQILGNQPTILFRLNSDGTYDNTFQASLMRKYTGLGTAGIRVLNSDKIIVGGVFSKYDTIDAHSLVRLNQDGSLDQTFNSQDFIDPDAFIQALNIDDNGNIFIGGTLNSMAILYKADINGDPLGSFANYTDTNHSITSIESISQDTIVFGGSWIAGFGTEDLNPLHTINSIGNVSTYNPIGLKGDSDFRNILKINQHEVFIAGRFKRVNNSENEGLAKVSLSGIVDPYFNFNVNGRAIGVIPKNADYIYAFGEFSKVNSSNITGIVRIFLTNDVPILVNSLTTFTTQEDSLLTLLANDFLIDDADDSIDKLLVIAIDGDNYTVNENVILPAPNFNGTLTVGVKVTDGKDTSNVIKISIEVLPVNDPPEIVGTKGFPAVLEEMSFTVSIDSLSIVDIDGDDISSFTLSVLNGTNYNTNYNIITPIIDFYGDLSVNVVVNDGQLNSEPFVITVPISNVNDPPVITGLISQLSFRDSLLISINDLRIEDSDNSYPEDFTLSILDGLNYSVTNNVIHADSAYEGILAVRSRVSDGLLNSNVYELQIQKDVILGGLQTLFLQEFSIYPNPANHLITIDYPRFNSKTQVILYNIQGKCVYQSIGKKTVDIKNLEQGMYFLTIINKDRLIGTFRVVKSTR